MNYSARIWLWGLVLLLPLGCVRYGFDPAREVDGAGADQSSPVDGNLEGLVLDGRADSEAGSGSDTGVDGDGMPSADSVVVADGSLDGVVPPDSNVDGVANADSGLATAASTTFGGISDDVAGGVAVDTAGNIYLTGYYEDSIDFGGPTLSTVATVYDLFLASFTAAGVHRWSKNTNVDYSMSGAALAVDGDNNVYLVATLSGTVNLGGSDLVATWAFGSDVVVASFTGAGGHRWSGNWGGANYAEGRDIAVQSNGDVTATGTHWGLDFGGGPLGAGGTTNDFFVVGFNTDGAYRWARSVEGDLGDAGNAVALDAAGNTYTVGTFSDPADFGGGVVPSSAGGRAFLYSTSADGAYRWVVYFGGPFFESALAVVVNSSNKVTISGTFSDSIDLGGGALTSAGGRDIFLATFDTGTGAHIASRRFGGVGDDEGTLLRTNSAGDTYLAGTFNQTADIGRSVTSAGETDVFLASFAADGAWRSTRRYGGVFADSVGGMALSGGDVLLSGTFSGSVDFGNGAKTSAGGSDIFLLRLR